MSQLSIQSTLPLTGTKVLLPRLGFGVYQSPNNVCAKSCQTALKAGYRHIDSAQYYGNEVEVGQSIAQSKIPREDVFLTTKMLRPSGSVEATHDKIIDSVEKLSGKGGYADMFLIHSPHSGSDSRKAMWQALEKAHADGRVKAIGVSNFGIAHIDEMKKYATIWPPHVNQIELHPWCQQREIVKYCQDNKIVLEAYCPLVRNTKADDKTLNAIANKHSKSPSQVLVRYCLQKGWVPLPKSDTPTRIQGNADVFDFEISSAEMKALDDLNEGSQGAICEAADNDAL